MQSGTSGMDAWSQWNAQRATAAAVTTAPGFQPPAAYPAATAAAAGLAAPVPPAGAVPPAPGAPVGGYPMGYPYYGSAMPSAAAVPGYNAQWAAMGSQQQNWQQWEQWQQQYAQWHQQYGSKYQAQMAAMQGLPGAAGVNTAAVAAPTSTTTLSVQSGSGDHLKDAQLTAGYGLDAYSHSKTSSESKSGPSVGDKRALDDISSSGSKGDSSHSDSKKSKSSDSKKETLEDLIEAEKAFDVQFKNWESQFDKWKEQNVNHPDKTQYREYESKWESWREQLLQKRDQMKKKRETKMEELKQESAKAAAAAAELASSNAAAIAASTNSTSSVPTGMGTAASYPTPGATPQTSGFPPMISGPPPMFGSPFAGGYNQPPYGGPMPPSQQSPFMMNTGQQGPPPPPPSMYPSMNMPPPIMNMGLPPMGAQPDVVNSSSADKLSNSPYDQKSNDPQSNNAPLNFVGSTNQGSNKGIPGLDLLSSGGSAQGNFGPRDTSGSGGGRGGSSNYQEPLSKTQPLLKTSDDCKAFDFPKSDLGPGSNQNVGSRFSGGPGAGPGPQSSYGPGSGPGSQSSYGPGAGLGPQSSYGPGSGPGSQSSFRQSQSSFGSDQNFYGNMQQPPSFNLPPPKGGGGQYGFDSSSNKGKTGIPSLMEGFDSNRGPPPGLMDKKDNQDESRLRSSRFDDDFRGGPDSKFAGPGSRWSAGNDSPAKGGSRWGEPEIPPDESTSFSRGSFGSRGDMPDKFRSPSGPNDDDRFSGPRGNFRDRFPQRGGSYDRSFGDFPDSRPSFGDDKFAPKGPRDGDDRVGDRQGPYFGGPDKFSSRGFGNDDRFGEDDYDDDENDGDRFNAPRDIDLPPQKNFGSRFSGSRGGLNDDGPGDKPFGFNDGPDRSSGPRGLDDGPDRFGGGGRGFGGRNSRNFGSLGPGGDVEKFPGSRPNDNSNDRFPARFPPRGSGGGGLLGDAPEPFPGPGDGPDRPDDIDDRDGPDRFFQRGPDFQRGSDSGRGGFGGRFGSPRGGFDGPGGFNKPGSGGFGFGGRGPPGGRFGGPNDGPFDDRRGFGGPGDGPGDMPGERFPPSRFGNPQDSPGRFGLDGRGKNDGSSKGPVSLLDLPPMRPPPLIDSDGPPPGPPGPRGRSDLDFDDDRFASPSRSWGGGSGSGGPGPSPKDGPDDWKNRYGGPGGPGPSPDRMTGPSPDWKMRGGPSPSGRGGMGPPYSHEMKEDWEGVKPSTVVDYGHRPRPIPGFSDYDEPESVEPIRTFDYEHGSKRGSRWTPDGGGKESRMQGNSRERQGGGRDGFRGPPPRGGGGGMNRDREDNRDRDRNKGGSGRDDKFNKDNRDNDNKYRNNSSDYDNRKGASNKNRSQNNRERGHDENINKQSQQHALLSDPVQPPVLVEDILTNANRVNRPPKIIIILRGPPGSGKTFVAKLIKDKEVEMSGSTPRILSLDDYFIVETEKDAKDPETGRKITTKVMEYEYESGMEEHYRASLVKAFKKTISDGYFPFIIVDCVHDKISHYEEMYTFGKQNGFQVYITEMDMDVSTCSKRNIHKRSEKDIEKIVKQWEPTPPAHTILDVRSLLQSAAITEVDMEDSVQDSASGNNPKNNPDGSGLSKDGEGDEKDKSEKGGSAPNKTGPTAVTRPKGEENTTPETNPVVLKRREKQIGYVKRMPEYLKYVEIVPLDKRREFHPMTPDITKQMSRRAWDGAVQVWKDKVKDWWSTEGQGLNYIRDYVKNSSGNPDNGPDNPPANVVVPEEQKPENN